MPGINEKPFLKWAGGKTQLLDEFTKRIPGELKNGEITAFVEPFVGGGAVYFHFNKLFNFDECHLFDVNSELVLVYNVIKNDVDELVEYLCVVAGEFLSKNDEGRKKYYYSVRNEFNRTKPSINFGRYGRPWIERAGQLIFLNKTCFNGLFRVNSKGEFNVPFGRYKNPKIVYPELLKADSDLLQNTVIHLGDFEFSAGYIDSHAFVYFDPPYRPLNSSSSFTGYSSDGFDDKCQRRLAKFYNQCDMKNAKLMLSNSDPKNISPDDNYFDDMYRRFKIERLSARRNINSDASKRGDINEILVMNYDY
ncbi:DNA adenine methylase [Methanomicrobium sp. W14]|uniref:DNA adenine methylase n=1 Tax=Methanomicrobium sp. W14 TaxID=2817839 RepID=UPI001AE9216A|nr:Dam family site-specific DNA-(adenine-N6)-methyltransferase [Methanomicrobium sp. W14]MBP2133464.1 DNA adenine methylase [Methanomicrobium sp. W14]